MDLDFLHQFALELSLPVESLRRFGLGFAQGDEVEALGLRRAQHAWTFPMLGAHGEVVGIRIRLPRGEKLCVKLSRMGLFVPTDFPAQLKTLFVTEGETDAAALHAVGLVAIGRPGCRSCARLTADFVRGRKPEEVVVVSDADEVGRRGAIDLAMRLRVVCVQVRVIVPPEGIKDARAWVRAGATGSDIEGAGARAELIGLRTVGRSGRS